MCLVSLYNLFSFLSASSTQLYDIYCYMKESIISSHSVRKKRYGALQNGRLNEFERKDMVVKPRRAGLVWLLGLDAWVQIKAS